MIQKKVEVNGQVYTVRKPVGRIGTIHFGLIMKCVPKDALKSKTLDDFDAQDVMDLDKITDVFVEWSEKVLPHLIVDGPYKYEEMPGEDQFAIFMSMVDAVKVSKEFFRVIES